MKVDEGTFSLSANEDEKTFQVRVFKFFAPRTAKSKVSLVAHRREVTDNPLESYIPEFAEEFFEPGPAQVLAKGDRKSVVSGKRGSCSVEFGGRRNIKKKKRNTNKK